MDPFSSSSSIGSSQSGPSAEAIMGQLKNQLAQAYAEELLEDALLHKLEELRKQSENVRGKCFAKCIAKPGTSLSGSESSCISRCVDRYIEATGIIGRALFSPPR